MAIHNDKELFLLIAQGDEAAFKELFHLYVPRIEPLIFNIVKTDMAVKDIVQEVFLHLWLDREKLSLIHEPANWIFKIVYNRSYSWVKKQLVRERVSSDISDDNTDDSTEELLAFNELSRLFKQAVNALSPQAKRIYLLRESGLKPQEISQQLGISTQSVKNSLYRSTQSIKDLFTKHGIRLPLFIFIGLGRIFF